MAAFTSLALASLAAGGGLLGGTLLGRKKAKNQQQTLAPGETAANAQTPSPITPPAPPIVNPGDQQAIAQQAGAKQRKRAASGSLLTAPKRPASSTPGVAPRYSRPTLLGS